MSGLVQDAHTKLITIHSSHNKRLQNHLKKRLLCGRNFLLSPLITLWIPCRSRSEIKLSELLSNFQCIIFILKRTPHSRPQIESEFQSVCRQAKFFGSLLDPYFGCAMLMRKLCTIMKCCLLISHQGR